MAEILEHFQFSEEIKVPSLHHGIFCDASLRQMPGLFVCLVCKFLIALLCQSIPEQSPYNGVTGKLTYNLNQIMAYFAHMLAVFDQVGIRMHGLVDVLFHNGITGDL
jgi:hypothetical protein